MHHTSGPCAVVVACQVKALLPLADACEPAAIRCRILQELPLVWLRRKDEDDFEPYDDALLPPLLPEYVDVALAAVTVRHLFTRTPTVCMSRGLPQSRTHTLAGYE
jgi:hypothetical protein